MQTELKNTELTKINKLFKIEELRDEIIKQYGSVYKYAKHFGLSESQLSMLLNKKRPISLRQILKHLDNLKMRIVISLVK